VKAAVPNSVTGSWLPLQGAAALGLTVLLVAFLVALRILSASRIPEETIRLVEVAPEMALPAPPPPPPPDTPDEPPPPQRVELPRLEPRLDPSAPPLKAQLDPNLDLTMKTAMFELEVDPPPTPSPRSQPRSTSRPRTSRPSPQPVMRTTYSAGELDSRPRLRYAPSITYPTELLRQGIKHGRVVVEVTIDTSGRVSVRRVLSSTHPRFSSLARSVASRSRYTTPTKNGRPVKAIYRWPLVFRP